MDEKGLLQYGSRLLGGEVGGSYISQGLEATKRRQRLVNSLLEHRKIPEEGWDEQTIEWFLQDMSLLDSNNFAGNVGAGEREARIVSGIVQRRHFYLGHGIGRSGDIAAVQPKAAGSSIVNKLTTQLVKDLLCRVLGMRNIKGVLIVPMATGMALVLVLLAIRAKRPRTARYVLWPRIDQKTCLKAIVTAGFEPVVIEEILDGDEVRTDVDGLRSRIEELGSDNILCVLSTTSCFAPRIPDNVEEIAKLCLENGNIPHVVNNAYGLQCSKICHRVNMACRNGRVDAIVQSTDKNLMVPVGGAIIAGPMKNFVEKEISQTYAGRASISPILDVFVTLIQLGTSGFCALRNRRIELIEYFHTSLDRVALKYDERVLSTSKSNTISFAVTLNNLGNQIDDVTKFGSMLFTRGVSGARVVARDTCNQVAGINFKGYGASINNYHSHYFTAACSIGVSKDEIDTFATRLDKCFGEICKTKQSTEKNKTYM